LFRTRLIISILWVPIIVAIIAFGEPIHTLALVLLMVVVGVMEFNNMMVKRGIKPSEYVTITASIILLITIYLTGVHSDKGVILYILGFIFMLTVVWHLFRDGPRDFIGSSGATILCIFYVAWFFSHLVLIRNLEYGNRLLVVLFLIIWASDVAAYGVGRFLGKHKIAPSVSPKKSWEGALGGLLGGMWASVGSFYFFMGAERWPGLLWSLAIGSLVTVGGMFGDFIESAIKRDAQVKDSGTFLPGHGGLLDRFDSIMVAAPIFFYLMLLYKHPPSWLAGLLY